MTFRSLASSIALLVLSAVASATPVPCPAGTKVLVGTDAVAGEVVAAGRHLLHVVTEAEPDGTWRDVRQEVIRPVRAPEDRCLASAPEDGGAVSFGLETKDDDDPPRD